MVEVDGWCLWARDEVELVIELVGREKPLDAVGAVFKGAIGVRFGIALEIHVE